jgi:hypothetical protein
MRRFIIPLLVMLAVVFGSSYAAAVINWFMGPWQAVGMEHDGKPVHMAFDRNMPRPDWVPFYPGATVVQASRVTSAQWPSGFYALDISVRGSYEEVRRFYGERLTAAGFTVSDSTPPNLNPATAAMLGIAGSLSGRRAETDDAIDVMIRTHDGLFSSRAVQIHWHKISERTAAWPAEGAQAAAAGRGPKP